MAALWAGLLVVAAISHPLAMAQVQPPAQTQGPVPGEPHPSGVPESPPAISPSGGVAEPLPSTGSEALPKRHFPRYPRSARQTAPAVLPPAATPETPAANSGTMTQESAAPEPSAKPVPAQLDSEAALEQAKQDPLANSSVFSQCTMFILGVVLVVLILVLLALLILIWRRARDWNRRFELSVESAEASQAEWQRLLEQRAEPARELASLLQRIGDRPLSFEEEGPAFSPQDLPVLDDIDHLAYAGDARLAFGKPQAPADAAVYLNGLLLSAVGWLERSAPWTALARLNRFLSLLGNGHQAVDPHRIAQACSFRALAAFESLERQDAEPSWVRSGGQTSPEDLLRQAFADISQAARLDAAWSHTTFVEALLSSRYYAPGDTQAQGASRTELHLRGLHHAVGLWKKLISEKRYRGPARRHLARCLKRIAEVTGEKGDFSDFGYVLTAFPADEELADESLAARQPDSQDRFLWQWLLGDEELFRAIDRLNLTEYRSFWVQLLDSKVHLRNWRADLAEMQRKNPLMRDWGVQLLHIEPPISLTSPFPRRPDRFDTPSGA